MVAQTLLGDHLYTEACMTRTQYSSEEIRKLYFIMPENGLFLHGTGKTRGKPDNVTMQTI